MPPPCRRQPSRRASAVDEPDDHGPCGTAAGRRDGRRGPGPLRRSWPSRARGRDRLTRTFLSPPMRRVHEHLAGWMAAAGMARPPRPGGQPDRPLRGGRRRRRPPVLMIGSHLDTVPDAGKYDGVLGVLLGVAAVAGARRAAAAVRASRSSGSPRRRASATGRPTSGSLAACGRFDPALLDRTDADGVAMADAFRGVRARPGPDRRGRLPAGPVAGLPGGPHRAGAGARVAGACRSAWSTAIAGQSRLRVAFEGRAGPRRDLADGPAGATPCRPRPSWSWRSSGWPGRSTGCARRSARSRSSPGASNVVPGPAALSLDVRHADDAVRERAVAEPARTRPARSPRAGGWNSGSTRQRAPRGRPGRPGPDRPARLGRRARPGVEPRRLVSGAGHDAAVMAALAPMAMLFLRSPGGHQPPPRRARAAGGRRGRAGRASLRCPRPPLAERPYDRSGGA